MVSDHWEVRLPENSSGVKPQGQSGVEDTPSPRASYSNLGSESPQLSEGSCFWTETFPVQFLISTFPICEEGQMISLLLSHIIKHINYIFQEYSFHHPEGFVLSSGILKKLGRKCLGNLFICHCLVALLLQPFPHLQSVYSFQDT